jgi:hypothetical protein
MQAVSQSRGEWFASLSTCVSMNACVGPFFLSFFLSFRPAIFILPITIASLPLGLSLQCAQELVQLRKQARRSAAQIQALEAMQVWVHLLCFMLGRGEGGI